MPAPVNGPCSPWCTAEDVMGLPWVQAAWQKTESQFPPDALERICAEAALGASEILYELSGRLFTGECGPVTIRPLARPTDIDTRTAWYGGFGFNTSWGYANSYDSVPGVAMHYGSLNPPEIQFDDYPVTEVTLVKIDGIVIPSEEYELRDYRTLVRIRPTTDAVPTERYGWPTAQVQDWPDTQVGTFSVTYLYGQPPSAAGKLAAKKLAEYLALPQLGDNTHFPRRTSNVTRQGVTVQTSSPLDLLKAGQLGIYEVDVFLNAVNPKRNQRQAAVWSPDLGRPRRQAAPSTS